MYYIFFDGLSKAENGKRNGRWFNFERKACREIPKTPQWKFLAEGSIITSQSIELRGFIIVVLMF